MKFSSSPNRPSTWKEMKLADICKIFTSGGTPSRKKPEYFENGNIPWVRTKELNDGIISEVEEFITPEALKNSSAKMLPKDTILLAMYGATVGKLGILGIESSCNQACAAMVPKDGIVDYRFLFYLLLNHRELIISQATGGAQQNLSGELIKGFTFDFPTYDEQKAISEVLYKLDEKIVMNNKLSKTLEDIAQAIFQSWFIDFDPVKAKMAGEKPVGMDTTTAALFPDSMEKSELGLIPQGWEVRKIESLCETFLGGTPSRAREEFWGGKIPWINSGKVNDFRISAASEYITELGLEKSATKLLPKGTTVLAITGATLGQFSRLEIDSCANQSVVGIVGSSEASNEFIFLTIKNGIQRLISAQTGGAQQHINKEDVNAFFIVYPGKKLMNTFTHNVEEIFSDIGVLINQSTTLAEIRDSLLPRLISGELQIPEEMLAS